jgi:hypothetical protein
MSACKYSDATQRAALQTAKRAVLYNERPSQSQRELIADQIDDVIARIDRAGSARQERVASQKERQADIAQVMREERGRR